MTIMKYSNKRHLTCIFFFFFPTWRKCILLGLLLIQSTIYDIYIFLFRTYIS